MCPLVLQKLVLRVPFSHRSWGIWAQQIQEFARKAMKTKMLVQVHNLRLLDEAREVAHYQHLGPENQDSQHMLDQPRGSFPQSIIYKIVFRNNSYELRIFMWHSMKRKSLFLGDLEGARSPSKTPET